LPLNGALYTQNGVLVKSDISPNYLNVKFIGYLTFITVYYYLINFVAFDVFSLEEGQYAYLLGLNMGLCALFSIASNQQKMSFQENFVEPVNEKRANHASLLVLCAWVIFYEEFILQIHFSKFTGFALLVMYPSISYFLSNDQTVDTLDDGKSYFENNPKAAILHWVISTFIGFCSISLILFGEWVSPLR